MRQLCCGSVCLWQSLCKTFLHIMFLIDPQALTQLQHLAMHCTRRIVIVCVTATSHRACAPGHVRGYDLVDACFACVCHSTMCVSVCLSLRVCGRTPTHMLTVRLSPQRTAMVAIFAPRQLPGKLMRRLTRSMRMCAGQCKAPSEPNKVLVGVFVRTDDQLRPGARSSEAARHQTRTHAPCRHATPRRRRAALPTCDVTHPCWLQSAVKSTQAR